MILTGLSMGVLPGCHARLNRYWAKLNRYWGVWFGGNWFMLVFETKFEWGSLKMAHDFEQKYVGLVATIIGAVVLLLGIGGLLFNLS